MLVRAYGEQEAVAGFDLSARFRADGFVKVPQLAPSDEIPTLARAFDSVFAPASASGAALINFAGEATDPGQYEMPQLENLSQHMPILKTLECTARAVALAQTLLGPRTRMLFDFGLSKRPFSPVATPWHQDIAFVGAPSFHEMITIWMPLQDVAEENGCLSYVPGSHHKGVLPHRRVESNDNGLVYDGAVDNAVACPLKAGDAVVHHFRTLHAAGGNSTAQPRRAIAWGFGVRRAEATVPQPFPWSRQSDDPRVRSMLKKPAVLDLANRIKLALGVR